VVWWASVLVEALLAPELVVADGHDALLVLAEPEFEPQAHSIAAAANAATQAPP